MYEFDGGLALINIEDAQKLYRLDGGVGRPAEARRPVRRAARGARAARRSCPSTREVARLDAQPRELLPRGRRSRSAMMFIILTLIVAVAAFNIVSALVMAVTDKQADIAILRTLGARAASIMKIFMVQGALIGVIGTVLGVVGGVAAGAQHRRRRARHRARCSACSFLDKDGLLHQRAALRSATCRRASLIAVDVARAARWSRRSIRAGGRRGSIRREALRYE